jgi:tetratricopeptide (TPR) repeat protein
MTTSSKRQVRRSPTRRAQILAVLLIVAGTATATADPDQTALKAREARLELLQAAASGALEPALKLFLAQRTVAAAEGTLVEYVLEAGPAFARLLTHDTPRPTTRALVEVYWLEVIPRTTGAERLRAVNDCGVLLLEAGWHDEALGMWINLEPATALALEEADGVSAARFLVNAGVALEEADQGDAALEKFLAALVRDPSSREALASIERRAAELPPSRAVRTWIATASRLLEGRQLESAATVLERAVALAAESGVDAAARPLLSGLVRYLGAAPVEPGTIRERWRPGLERLARATGDTETRSLAEDLLATLRDPRQVAADGGGAWASTHPDLFSRLLLRLARGLEQTDPKAAVVLYDLAWRMEPENFDAVIYLVNLLGERADTIDPGGRHLAQLVAELFEAKSLAYKVGDLEEIARLHVILGTIYERQGRWGSPDEVESAVFQWRGALTAQERLARQRTPMPGGPPVLSPILHTQLAHAYEKADAARWGGEVVQHYSLAAEGYLDREQPEAADVMVERARRARPVLSPAEVDRLRVLDARVVSATREANSGGPATGGAADIGIRDEIYQRLLADPEVRSNWETLGVQVENGQAVIQGVAIDGSWLTGLGTQETVEQQVKAVRGVTKVDIETQPPH